MKMNLGEDEEFSSDEDLMDTEIAQHQFDAEGSEEKLSQNPYDYEAHLALISHYRRQGQFEELQKARNTFKNHFALSAGSLFLKVEIHFRLKWW